jgi:hypothetical protein
MAEKIYRSYGSCRWENSNKICLKEVAWYFEKWIILVSGSDQRQVIVNGLIILAVLLKTGNNFSSWATVSSSEVTVISAAT